MSDRNARRVLRTADVLTDENRLVIEGIQDLDDESYVLAGVLVERYSGIAVGHLREIVERAVGLIEARALVSPETIVIPELGEGYRAARDG